VSIRLKTAQAAGLVALQAVNGEPVMPVLCHPTPHSFPSIPDIHNTSGRFSIALEYTIRPARMASRGILELTERIIN
jgi:hypothetical protein